jgi:hypothetical protein
VETGAIALRGNVKCQEAATALRFGFMLKVVVKATESLPTSVSLCSCSLSSIMLSMIEIDNMGFHFMTLIVNLIPSGCSPESLHGYKVVYMVESAGARTAWKVQINNGYLH